MPSPADAVSFGAFVMLHPPAEQWTLARRIEALGFDSLWCGDHLSFHGPIYESLTLLASYASITSRIRLGTAVYLLALRPPAVAAKVTATLDALSGGRLIFGVGVGGENPREFELAGVPHGERGARVTEGIDVVRALWRDGPATFKGRFTHFEGVSIDPKPVQAGGPPIWIGGRSDAALARAGRQGDGWVSYVVTPERYAQSLAKIRAAAQAQGRSLDGFATAHLTFITVGRDYERARQAWVQRLSRRYAQDFGPLAQKYGVIGTPEQCCEQLERFRAAGCRTFLINAICDPDEEREQIETIGAEILPRFRPS
ncbi:MAG: LLM class flavin-dependent oxidoreductase [Candidatus Rokubacteria bacterium]|nr:LLM class flavin-dependent oxidoreductase [Candidatus Rokubacteria bacterium]MBI3826725.1 LLM class flavin-dependent oxidoreductase [Candidatus Rokubacteria bacterium]